MLKVVILGHGDMLAHLIAGAIDSNMEIVGVFRYDYVNKPFFKRLINDFVNPSKEYSYIKSYNLKELQFSSANSEAFRKELVKLNPDVMFVGTWGEKIKKETFVIPRLATINVHPSLLPQYRGSNPYLQVIWHKEKQTGVTFHIMDENFDTGPILMQKVIEILPKDTGKELKERTVLRARFAICELLHKLDNEIITPIPQRESISSYYPQIKEEDVMLDFSQSAEDVCAHIRAFHPWTKCFFPYRHKFLIPNPYKIEITTEKPASETFQYEDASITVLCGDKKYLKMSDLKFY